MGNVIFDTSMSLDGFMTAAGRTTEEPLGAGGERLHEWVTGGASSATAATSTPPSTRSERSSAGARRTNDSVRWWGADGPTGDARRPVFVVTHAPPTDSPPEGVYRFVEGIPAALEQAQAAAGAKDVTIMGGADLGQQMPRRRPRRPALHPSRPGAFFGAGTRMFERLGEGHVELEPLDVIDTPAHRTCASASCRDPSAATASARRRARERVALAPLHELAARRRAVWACACGSSDSPRPRSRCSAAGDRRRAGTTSSPPPWSAGSPPSESRQTVSAIVVKRNDRSVCAQRPGPVADRGGLDRRRGAAQLDRPGAPGRRPRLSPLLGGRAPRDADARLRRAPRC